MNSITKLILLIKPRLAAHITRNSISCLKAFLDGWFLRDANSVEDSHVMESFQSWITRKYNMNSAHSWCDIILFYSTDEGKALFKFFDEFDEFLNQQGTSASPNEKR